MLRHLSERYGEIETDFLVNYEIEAILARVGLGPQINDAEMLALKNPTE